MKTREDFRGKKGFIIIGVLAVSLALGLGGGVVLKNKKAESKAMVSAKETVKELSVKGTDGKSFKRDSFEHKTEAPDYAKSNETVSTDNAGASNPDTGSGAENTGNTENTSTSNPSTGNASAGANNNNSGKKSGTKTNIKSASNTSENQGNASAKQNRKASAGETATQPAATPSQPASNSQQAQPVQPAKPSGHYETRQILVSAAYDEPMYEWQVVGAKCNTCGQVFPTTDDWIAHVNDMDNHNDYTHGSYSGVYGQVQTGTKHHDAVYKTEQVWVQD